MAKNDVNDTFTKKFADAKFTQDEQFIVDNLMYEIIAGSRAYGVENPDSDYDVVAIFMNKHGDLYPQNYGYILGFDTEIGKFDNKECKGVGNRLTHKGVDLEAEWRSLTNFAYLATFKGSPNIVESLFVRQQNIKYIHPAFVPIKDNAPKFISMKSFHAFKGYMHGQFHRVKNNVDKNKTDNPLRQWMLEAYGYDVKMSYHILRLIDILMQMLDGETHLDLMRNKEECKAMRNGDWGSWDDFCKYTTEKFAYLDLKAGDCKLPVRPRISEVRNIINSSIESWYGSNEGQHVQQREFISVEDIKAQLDRIENSVKGINII